MSRIYFKGNMPMIEVTPAEAHLAQSAFESGKMAAVIKIQNLTFKVSEIKGISFDENVPDTQAVKNIAAWHSDRRKFASKTPEEKTASFITGPAKLVTSIASEVDREVLRERVLAFFRENPKRCYPNVSVFDGLWREHHHVLHMFEAGGIRILGNAIGADARAVKEDEEYQPTTKSVPPLEQEELSLATDLPF